VSEEDEPQAWIEVNPRYQVDPVGPLLGPDPMTVRLREHMKAHHGMEVVAGSWDSVEALHGRDHDLDPTLGEDDEHGNDHDRVWGNR
jgi:hypothetical protein